MISQRHSLRIPTRVARSSDAASASNGCSARGSKRASGQDPSRSVSAISLFTKGTPATLKSSEDAERSEWPENREHRKSVQELLLGRLNGRTVDDHNVTRINLRVRSLAAADGHQVESRRLPAAADLPENSDTARICIFRKATGQRHRLHQR